jgi:hypothetical protein
VDEVAAIDLARPLAQNGLSGSTMSRPRLDLAESFERRDQRAAQRRRHPQRIAETTTPCGS